MTLPSLPANNSHGRKPSALHSPISPLAKVCELLFQFLHCFIVLIYVKTAVPLMSMRLSLGSGKLSISINANGKSNKIWKETIKSTMDQWKSLKIQVDAGFFLAADHYVSCF